MSAEEAPADPVRTVVIGVVAEALRVTGSDGLRLHRAGTPEHGLVRSWAVEAGWRVRDASDPEGGSGPEDGRRFLSTDPAGKLVLLLDGPLPGAMLLPLGDLWPAAIELRAGGATWPAEFQAEWGSTPDGTVPQDAPIRRAATALRSALEEGYGLCHLDAVLPSGLAHRVRTALHRTAPRFRPPLIPKLTSWTPGIDAGL